MSNGAARKVLNLNRIAVPLKVPVAELRGIALRYNLRGERSRARLDAFRPCPRPPDKMQAVADVKTCDRLRCYLQVGAIPEAVWPAGHGGALPIGPGWPWPLIMPCSPPIIGLWVCCPVVEPVHAEGLVREIAA